MKYWTIDLEGDGLRRSLNQQIFTSGNHFDPETRIWCCTICRPKEDGTLGRRTLVCKLPPVPRRLIAPYKNYKGEYVWNTNAKHEPETVIPEQYVREEDAYPPQNYANFLWKIESLLENAKDKGIPVYYKSYGKYEYEKDLLRVNFEKFNGDTSVLECLKPYCVPDGVWKGTSEQVIVGGTPNQEYMNRGIKHNIEDTVQLYKIINSIHS